MPGINIQIPQDVVESLRLPPKRAEEEIKREFAVFLVREGLLSHAQARRIAEMERLAFEDLLASRQVPWEVSVEDVMGDLKTAVSTQSNRVRE